MLTGAECLGRWYHRLLQHPTVEKVLSGQSAFGVLERYWRTPPPPEAAAVAVAAAAVGYS
jgi:hypothetical protein